MSLQHQHDLQDAETRRVNKGSYSGKLLQKSKKLLENTKKIAQLQAEETPKNFDRNRKKGKNYKSKNYNFSEMSKEKVREILDRRQRRDTKPGEFKEILTLVNKLTDEQIFCVTVCVCRKG